MSAVADNIPKGANMTNYHELTDFDLTSNHHWAELNSKGSTTFVDGKEIYPSVTVSMDDITASCLIDLAHEYGAKGLHAKTLEGLPFIDELRNRIRTMKNSEMDEALEDFYK